MTTLRPDEPIRQRAPSKRALATRDRVLDAAEKIFAHKGFDGATIRDIAQAAGEPVGTVHHHGAGKEALFEKVVSRRAEALSKARLSALNEARSIASLSIEAVVAAFVRPLCDLAEKDPHWRDYARLVAFVSTDARWSTLARTCFDPTAKVFLTELAALSPQAPDAAIEQGFIFMVSALLALLTSQDRITHLSGGDTSHRQQVAHLIRFCTAGFHAVIAP